MFRKQMKNRWKLKIKMRTSIFVNEEDENITERKPGTTEFVEEQAEASRTLKGEIIEELLKVILIVIPARDPLLKIRRFKHRIYVGNFVLRGV